ncbi:hypothetical protein P43SY_003377 [Pythium insidiosum]|uniref:N-acetyltransferase domain-containing protein n=1 Tax=Pythium insidiosum TaxID=114742 RepID=A0AAD5Q9G3_PYTIN|nr:hypothetical protein P43SY_003377 [Pythium insidiosum]
MRANLDIRHAEIDDAEALSELAVRTFTETFAHAWKPDVLRDYLSTAYSVEKIRTSIKDPKTTILLAFQRGDIAPCAFATLLHDEPRPEFEPHEVAESNENHFELQKFYVDKPFHGRGVAQALMDRVFLEVRETRMEKPLQRRVVWLRVWESNSRAIQFYRNRGFHECAHLLWICAEMSFKPSLVEHVFRGVWEEAGGGAGAAYDASTGSDNDSADDLVESTSRTAAHVTKIHGDALKLSCEFLRAFVVEALRRAQMEAMVDDSTTVEPHHVEQILAQLLLDF